MASALLLSFWGFEELRRAAGDICAGESTPNSCQNDLEMSGGAVSLPDVLSTAWGLPRDDDDDDDRDNLSPEADRRSRLLDLAERDSRFREFGGANEFEGDMVRDSVALMPSSPTVACRISSKNVHSPSRRSEAICLPVRTRASRDGGGMGIVLRHWSSTWSGTSLSSVGIPMLATEFRSTDGSVADRGVRPTRSSSAGPGPPMEELGAVTGERRESVRAWEPWNTRRPLAEINVPLGATAARRLLRRSNSRLIRSCDTEELPTELMLCSRRWEDRLDPSGAPNSGERSGSIGSAWRLISVRFLDFSDSAHCFLMVDSSDSARCSSSRSSITLRS